MLHPRPRPQKSPAMIAHVSDVMLYVMLASLELSRAGQWVDASESELEQDEASDTHDDCPMVISLTKAQHVSRSQCLPRLRFKPWVLSVTLSVPQCCNVNLTAP